MATYPARLAVWACAAVLVTGCSFVRNKSNALKSVVVQPAPDAGFIANPAQQARRADWPFQKVWVKPGFQMAAYRELMVAPVNTRHMLEMDWLHKASEAYWLGNVRKDIGRLAQYFHDRVVKEFKEDPNRRFQVLDSFGQRRQAALGLELALIEINPSQPVLHALSWAGPPGTRTAAGLVNRRAAAFEGRLRDLQTGEVVATFADRDRQDIGPLDLTRLTWYGPARGIMDRWARQFVRIANRKPGELVTDPVPFTLLPF